MKVLNPQKNQFKNTFNSKEIKLSIAEDEQRHIMVMLRSQIYSNKILAAIREILCNAFDANIEAGNAQTPVKIKMPDIADPIWSVRDFGPGLTYEDIETIFTKYGKSTKRHSNELTGFLGIGSKAPLAYCDQFLVVSYVNGTMSVYVIAINNENDAILHMTDEKPTDEPNGICIKIPIENDDIHEFKKNTVSYLRYIQLSDAPYEILNDDYTETPLIKNYHGDNWYMASCKQKHKYMKEIDTGYAKIIMGHVPYELDSAQLYKMSTDICDIGECSSLFIKAPLGSLCVTASRESLEYNEQTMAYLNTLLPDIRKSVQETICHDVIHAANLYEATKLFNTAHNDLPYNLRSILKGLINVPSNTAVTQNLNFYQTKDEEHKIAMDCDEYRVKTLRNGKTQIKKEQRQYLRPEAETVLFRNDNYESKSKRGRRIKAYLTSNPEAQLIMVNEPLNIIENSTMASYVDSIKKISEVDPLPINYSGGKGKGSQGPTKATGELFHMLVSKTHTQNNINRDCFEIIEDPTAYLEKEQLDMAIQINGFRYAGDDEQYAPDDSNIYPKTLVHDLLSLLEERYDEKPNIVAYRPKHEKDFNHIQRFFPYAINKIREELKSNPDVAWEIMLKREQLDLTIQDVGYNHDLCDLLQYLEHSKFTPLRNLACFKKLHDKLHEDTKTLRFDSMLKILKIHPQKFTRKKLPDLKDLTQKTFEKHPILFWIQEPHYYRWNQAEHKEEKEIFHLTLQKIIK